MTCFFFLCVIECVPFQVVFLISSAVRDLFQAEFVSRRDHQNFPVPSIPPVDREGYALKEWTLLNVYGAGSLLGKSCQGTLKLAGHSEEMQRKGYQFGEHLALAWQVMRLAANRSISFANPFFLPFVPSFFSFREEPRYFLRLTRSSFFAGFSGLGFVR